MTRRFPTGLNGLLLVCVLLSVLAGWIWPPAGAASPPRFRILVFSKTAGFRHASIPAGIAAVKELGAEHGFAVDATEDAAVFTSDTLSRYAAVVFLSTTGDVFDEAQQEAFVAYIRGGGGYVGVHSAASTEKEWPWYAGLVGAYLDNHPQPQEATILVLDRTHPSTRTLPLRWQRFDEWYNYTVNPRGNVHVLAVLDERSYEGGQMGPDHPIVWAHRYEGGRAWHTGLGHTDATYQEPLFVQHLLGGIAWAAGVAEGDVGATLAANYEKVVLMDAVTDPMELAVAPDGRVFVVERAGAIKVWKPETKEVRLAGYLPVYEVIEDGLLGITLDPRFEENNWFYVFYAPEGGGPSRLSRFTLDGDVVNMASEKVLLEVTVQREKCCHAGGSLTFDGAGNLYLSTGDNTDASDRGGSPLDERPGHAVADAQRSAGNANDLRGKILRIHPEPDGSYTIPEGNLFPAGTPGTRPEVYTMGHRNPFRIAIDAETGWLYWGDVGNGDAPSERGGWGWDEFNRAKKAGNFGWPYFTGNNQPYRDYDYAADSIGAYFDPDAPVNDSPNNTGVQALPPAQPALIWYTYGASEEFPEMGAGGISPMAGPVYHYDPKTAGPRALPAYYDDTFILYEWMRDWVQEVKFDEAGEILKISPFLPGMTFVRPMDMEVGPDGALYVIEWGDEFWGSNENAQVVRLDYYGSPERPPVVSAVAEPASGPAPLRVRFTGTAAHGRESSDSLAYAWDFDGDGNVDARVPDPSYTYERPGRHTARLTVIDAHGMQAQAAVDVTAGNTAPSVSIAWPVDGGFFDYDEPITFSVAVTDPEDGAPAADRVIVQPYTAFDAHRLPLPQQTGTEGTFQVTHAYTHTPDVHLVDRYAVLEARYRDGGAAGADSLDASARVTLQPKQKEAEHVAAHRGARRVTYGIHPAAERYGSTALTVMVVKGGDYVAYAPVNLVGIDALTFRLKQKAAGTIAVRLDAPDGPLVADVGLDSTTMVRTMDAAQRPAVEAILHDKAASVEGLDPTVYEGWAEVTVPVTDPGGTHTLYLVFDGKGTGDLLLLDWIRFEGPGLLQRRTGADQ